LAVWLGRFGFELCWFLQFRRLFLFWHSSLKAPDWRRPFSMSWRRPWNNCTILNAANAARGLNSNWGEIYAGFHSTDFGESIKPFRL